MASPKATTEISADQYGQFVTFINRYCKVCSVQLTSRNRHDHQNFCKTHGLEHDRARMETKRSSNSPDQRRAPMQVVLQHTTNPDRQKVHSLLTKFLTNPRSKITKDDLLSGLVDYELIIRFRDL